MRCIFCLRERHGTKEHVFPSAIGGRLITNRECGPCNSMLGSRVDAALSDNFVIRGRRALLGLSGNSGRPPAVHEMLLGVATLAGDPDRRVQVTFDDATGMLEVRALHHASDVIMPDGTKARRIIIDERDKDQIPKIIQRERKRHGVPPLSEEQLAAEVRKAVATTTAIDRPQLRMELSCSFAYLRHAMLKIAYELAFLWLGEPYLDDPSAAELRTAICAPDPASTDRLPVWVGDAQECAAFKFWSADKVHHIAYAFAGADGIAIAVRIFDIHAAVVWVTKDATRYLSGPNANTKLRFLAIEPLSGNMQDVPVTDELRRVAAAMTASARKGFE